MQRSIKATPLPLNCINYQMENQLARTSLLLEKAIQISQSFPDFRSQKRNFAVSPVARDIDSACKFIGAGCATIGVSGSGMRKPYQLLT